MRLRAALIGCGKIGSQFADDPRAKGIQAHAHAYTECPDTELVAVCDADPAKAAACGARWRKPTYSDLDRMLAERQPQLVSICTPDRTHFEIARRIIDAPGIRGILLEKPVALTLPEARQIVELAAEKRIKLAVNYSRRFARSHRQLKEFLLAGKLGTIQGVAGAYGKGVLHNGTHWFDLLRFLIGEVVSVQGRNSARDQSEDPSIDVTLQLENGGIAFLRGLDHRAFSVFEMEITGTLGRVRIIDSGNTFEFFEVREDPNYSGYKALSRVDGISGGLADAMYNAIADLAACVADDREPQCGGADGLAALEIGLSARESARSLKRVGLLDNHE